MTRLDSGKKRQSAAGLKVTAASLRQMYEEGDEEDGRSGRSHRGVFRGTRDDSEDDDDDDDEEEEEEDDDSYETLDTERAAARAVASAAENGDPKRRVKSHGGWRSKWRNNLTARASSDSLAYFLSLSRIVLSAIFAIIYLGSKSVGDGARWASWVFFILLSTKCAGSMRNGFVHIQKGIRHEVVEANHAPAPWLWEMPGGEISLVVFATVIFTVPKDAASAVMAM